ncbi:MULTISPECIES: DnaA regulatory inactivator Hda [Gammaproteobacteria]|uniref:DnaA regulatory inactivator Hda n=1 Tax=Vreelandella halophila TaxID=86177 RepID=A0A9X4Y9F6_9GAMM|nr:MULTISPECIES: DnaA regulatory inactivator Hda [Gammaproteobacteria]KAA8985272.1 DnaA regulatory inactivator Hda [Halospina sp. K52047b]MYL25684.1 DnaA regulatory inactivator Hda [Halomonas utahensis]MYL76041.1 DnaA regulatory inactivator Hda [Halomonas sp. 22501_18_FS]
MTQTPSQFPLRIRLRDEAGFANFHAGSNGAVVERLQAWPVSADAGSLVLCGDAGAGKSHLLNAVCLAAESAGLQPVSLSLREAAALAPEALQGFEGFDPVCLDDLDGLPADPAWQEALLHLFNRVQDAGGRLLIASRQPPAALDWALPDLASRLRALPVWQLALPDDDQRAAMLRARAENRGLAMPEEVTRYILRRAPRDPGQLLGLLDHLDEASLQQQRRLTVPFVRQVLGW